MACNDFNAEFESGSFDSLNESQMTLMQPCNEAESPIRVFREKMEIERQAMARNFAKVRELVDTCEREFSDRFGQVSRDVAREIEERELQLKSIQQTLHDMSVSMKENSLISTLQVAQQPLLSKLQQLENEIAVLSDLKIGSDTGGIEESLRLFGNLNNPIEDLEFKDVVPEVEGDPIPNGQVAEEIPNQDPIQPQKCKRVPYADRKECVWSMYKSDATTEGLVNPRGVTICSETGTVFVSDNGNHRIQVCTSDGRHIRSIIHRDMSYPLYTVTSLNHNEIYVSSHYALVKFSVEGEFLAKCPISRGSYRGIDIDEKGAIYACEWRSYIVVTHDPNNLKVVKRLKLESVDVSRSRKLNDIRIRGDSIYVLFAHNGIWNSFSYKDFPLQIYNMKGAHVRSLASGSLLQKPVCFAVDAEGNCLVTDYWKHTVQIVSGTGALLGSIGKCGQGPGDLSYPTGIGLTREGRVLVVSTGKSTDLLQAF